MAAFISLAFLLLGRPAFQRHSSLLTSSPATLQAVTQLLLHHCLPSMAAQAESGSRTAVASNGAGGQQLGTASAANLKPLEPLLGRLSHSLINPCLAASIRILLRQPYAATLVHQAARIALAMPTVPPDGVELSTFLAWHQGAVCVFSQLAAQLQQACDSAVASSSGSASGGAVLEAIPRQETQAAAWEVVDLVPHVAQVLQALSAGSAGAEPPARVCQNYAIAAGLLGDDGFSGLDGIRSNAELASWAAAANVGMRLLPLLVRLNADCHTLSPERVWLQPDAANRLLQALLSLATGGSTLAQLWVNGRAATQDAAAAGSRQPTPAHLANQLCRLHKSTCSLVHWLAVSSNQVLLPGSVIAHIWPHLLEALHSQLLAAQVLVEAAEPDFGEQELSRCAFSVQL